MYSYAPLALRRVGAKKKFFARRMSPNKASETRPIRFNIRSTCLNHDTYIYFSVPPLPIQYRRAILYDTYIIYTFAGGKLAISLFIHPLLRTLLDKCHNYSERSLRSWWTWHGPRWNLLNHVIKNGNRRSHDRSYDVIRSIRSIRRERPRIICITRTSRIKGFLRS